MGAPIRRPGANRAGAAGSVRENPAEDSGAAITPQLETRLPPALLRYAALGWRVLPCWPGTKKAIEPHTAASADPAVIQAWQRGEPVPGWEPRTAEAWRRQSRFAGWALALGPASGVLALDVDGAQGERSLADLERRHGPLEDSLAMVESGSGLGWHLYFRHPGGELLNRHIGPSLEARGDKLLLMLPPSRHPSGGRYRWADGRDPIAARLQLPPAWLVDLLQPEPAVERPQWQPSVQPVPSRAAYLQRAIEAELIAVAGAPEGARNQTLNRSAHALLRFAADGAVDPGAIVEGLVAAARHAGLRPSEALPTIRSAARARGIAL
jgi:hypothetical protein